jgi:phosphopantothenoylcysteine synthetase/decarboxylase
MKSARRQRFQSDANKVLILHDNGRIDTFPMSKRQLAHEILARVVERLRGMD